MLKNPFYKLRNVEWIRKLLIKYRLICTCGSGAHPRECRKHIWGIGLHCAELNIETLQDHVQELEDRIEALEAQLKELKNENRSR